MIPFLVSFLLRSMALGAFGLLMLALLRGRSASLRHALAVCVVGAMLALPLISSVLPIHKVEVTHQPDSIVLLTGTAITPGLESVPGPEPVRAFDWNPLIADVWQIVSLILLARIAVGLAGLVVRVCRSAPLAISGRTNIAVDPKGSIPLMIWFGRSVVLLPPHWSSWPQERLDRILAHEEAHVRRHDWFTQLFLMLAVAAMWPNPFAHILVRRARLLAEQAADDRVLAGGAEPSSYASDLLEIARACKAAAPVFAIPMASKADVARRIELILDNKLRRQRASFLGLAIGVAMIGALCIPLSSWALGQSTAKAPAPADQSKYGGEVEIHAKVYSLASTDVLSSAHQFAVKQGTKCTDCHRDIKAHDKFMTMDVGAAMAVNASYADQIATRAIEQGGVLMMSPSIKTMSDQGASITISPTEENKRTITVGLNPRKEADGSVLLQVHITESVAGRTVEHVSGVIRCTPSQKVILTNKGKHRLVILDVKV